LRMSCLALASGNSEHITARNTVDEVIKESRERRLRGQSALLDALREYRRKRRY
jgi:hypothetical protein